jgi:uncharacterized protein (DUF1697 family)
VPTHVALLRGINLAGRNRVAMADLRAVAESLGHTDVATYIQSGNVVFTAGSRAGHAKLAAAFEAAIAASLDVAPRVVVVGADELAAIAEADPYRAQADPKRVHIAFHPEKLPREAVAAVQAAQAAAAAKGSRDEATVIGRALYLHTPDGAGRSVLAALLARRDDGGTMRNRTTVSKLVAMLA